MRVIHCNAVGGRCELVLFTESDDDATSLVDPEFADLPGFIVDFDHEVDLPGDFFPSIGDSYITGNRSPRGEVNG